jgi:hypothetical protein
MKLAETLDVGLGKTPHLLSTGNFAVNLTAPFFTVYMLRTLRYHQPIGQPRLACSLESA